MSVGHNANSADSLFNVVFFFYDEKGKKNFITVRWEAKISKHFVLMRVFPETKYLLWFCRLTDGILCFHNARRYRRGMFLFNFYVIFYFLGMRMIF